ncbi:hypothetical protein CR513_61842, partial [Mucuna pruriens]
MCCAHDPSAKKDKSLRICMDCHLIYAITAPYSSFGRSIGRTVWCVMGHKMHILSGPKKGTIEQLTSLKDDRSAKLSPPSEAQAESLSARPRLEPCREPSQVDLGGTPRQQSEPPWVQLNSTSLPGVACNASHSKGRIGIVH